MSAPTPQQRHDSDHAPGPLSKCRQCAINWQTCRRKRRYDSPQAAHTAAVEANIENDWARPLVPYRCCYCTLWHLTTAKTKRRLRRAESMRRRWLESLTGAAS